jgi:hypothetical protein
MRLYHRTSAAPEILAGGFRDTTDYYLTNNLHTGVWFSTVPLSINEGADGDVLLVVDLDLPEDQVRDEYEWIEDAKPFREFLIPAAVVNEHATDSLVTEP